MSAEEKKFRNSIIFWVAVVGFVMGLLGNVVSQSFVAGGVVKTLDTAVKDIGDIKKDLNSNYLKKETFQEYRDGKDNEIKYINQNIEDVKSLLNELAKELRRKK